MQEISAQLQGDLPLPWATNPWHRTPLEYQLVFAIECALTEEEPMESTAKIEMTMYGIAEVIKWCIDKNKGRIPGVDTDGFKKMQALLAERPQSGDYFTLDQFWKKKVVLELTEQEVETIDRCLYDIPNFENVQLPQIRHKFWPKQPISP